MPRFRQSLEAFSSPVGVLDAEVVNRDQREKLTVRQLGGVSGMGSQASIFSVFILELLRVGSGDMVEFVPLRSSVCVSGGWYEK